MQHTFSRSEKTNMQILDAYILESHYGKPYVWKKKWMYRMSNSI